ncbi:MAG TPA: RNA polymerase sigma factor [Bryobacteraceae bacterium]|nr:RNA polymerase sigma factor [Bryobacteraceae bacterium]
MTDSEFRDSFHRYKDLLYRFVYRMTGSVQAAEDLVQECFTSLWEKPRGYDPGRGSLQAYLLGMARNLVLKRWSRESRYGSEEPEELLCPPFDVLRMERSEAIAAAVQALPPLQREALVLAEYEELSLDEIVRATGADLAAVKSRLHRARQNLRRVLAPLLETKGNLYGTSK